MSRNIKEIYDDNPITSNTSSDLMYFGQSPYASGDDAGMTYASFAAQFGAPYTPAAITRTNDTNVTLTLGGTPTTALLQAVSLTLGWTGVLAIARGGTGVASVTTSPTASSFAGWDSNANLSANNFLNGYTTTVTAAGTTTLAVGSTFNQYFTGSTTQTVVLPVTSTLALGQSFRVVNNSSGVVTVNSSGGNTLQAMAAGTMLTAVCILTSGTGTSSWSWSYGNNSISLPLSIANGGTGVSSVTTAASATAWAGWDANSNMSADSFIDGYTSTAPAAGTTTLTVNSTKQQAFTGSTTQTVTMPVTSTLVTGQQYRVINLSSGVVTVQSSGANTIQAMASNTQLTLTCISTSGTGTSSWSWMYSTLNNTSTGFTTIGNVTSGTAAFDGTAGTILTGTTSGLALLAANNSGGVGGAVSLTGGSSTNATSAGGSASLVGGAGNTTGAGGSVFVTGGLSGASGAGGDVTIAGGTPSGTTGSGGAVTIVSGAPSSSGGNNAFGGAVSITSSASVGNRAGPAVSITSGAGGTGTGGTGGALNITAGNAGTGSSSSAGGAITITAGSGANVSSPGAISITGQTTTGTNQNAANFTMTCPRGSGTGQVGKVFITAGNSGTASGTTSHTAINRLIVNGSVTGMTSGAASTIATPTIASNTMQGGVISYTVEASDGTDFQVNSGIMGYSITNKAGTIGGTAAVIGAEVARATVGSLVNTFAITAAGLVQITPTVVGMTATTLRVTYTVMHQGQQALTVPS